MSELSDRLETEIKRIINEPTPEIETDGIFDQSTLDSAGYPMPPTDHQFSDNPMKMLAGMMGDLKDMALHRGPFVLPSMPPSEHKVRIFRLNDQSDLPAIEGAIEGYLNDDYCSHPPVVCNDFVIMDFSRRKETEEDGKQ